MMYRDSGRFYLNAKWLYDIIVSNKTKDPRRGPSFLFVRFNCFTDYTDQF